MKVEISEISRRLADQVHSIAAMLLPGGKQSGAMWKAGDLNGGAGKSVVVHLSGSKMGRWAEYADSESNDTRGDLIDLWRVTKGITAAQAIREAKQHLGIYDASERPKTAKYTLPTSNGCHPPNPKGAAMLYMTEKRLILESTLKAYKVQVQPEKKAIVFPCYSPDGTLINRSYRTLEKNIWQETGCAPCLFGWQSLTDSVYQSGKICITEGQFDAMTMHQWGIPCLSIPNGSGQSWVEYSWEDLEIFQTIYLAFDKDGSGAKNAEGIAEKLGKHRCLIVSFPHKDANDCLKQGCTAKEAKEWIASAKPFQIKNLVMGDQMADRVVEEMRPKPTAFTLPMFKIEWPKRGLYFRPREVTVWTGPTSAGKSTFLNFLIVAYILSMSKVFVASMEMLAETNIAQMVSSSMESSPDEPIIRSFVKEFGKYMAFADLVGEIKSKELLEMMWYCHRVQGINVFFIDSLMKIADLEEDFPAQGEFFNTLTKFAIQTGSHVHLVAHAKKVKAGERVVANDVKGSSLIINQAMNVVAITRNHKKDLMRKEGTLTPMQEMEMHDTEITVEKQRASGWVGSYLLKFNPRDYTYTKK